MRMSQKIGVRIRITPLQGSCTVSDKVQYHLKENADQLKMYVLLKTFAQ